MKPTRRMASIRAGCWCRGTAFTMSRKPFRLRSQSQPERNSRVSGWQQQYFAGVYYGVILADTVVRVWGIVREPRRGQHPVPPSPFLRGGSIVLWEQITTIDKRQCRHYLGTFDAPTPSAAASRLASGRLFRKEKTCLRKAIYRNSSEKQKTN